MELFPRWRKKSLKSKNKSYILIELSTELSTQDKVNELIKLMSEDSYNYGIENGEYHITPNTEVINKAIERLK